MTCKMIQDNPTWDSPHPTHCDICENRIKYHFVDGRTRGGPWCIMCTSCHMLHGVGLGMGRGQKYTRKSLTRPAHRNPFYKVEG